MKRTSNSHSSNGWYIGIVPSESSILACCNEIQSQNHRGHWNALVFFLDSQTERRDIRSHFLVLDADAQHIRSDRVRFGVKIEN